MKGISRQLLGMAPDGRPLPLLSDARREALVRRLSDLEDAGVRQHHGRGREQHEAIHRHKRRRTLRMRLRPRPASSTFTQLATESGRKFSPHPNRTKRRVTKCPQSKTPQCGKLVDTVSLIIGHAQDAVDV